MEPITLKVTGKIISYVHHDVVVSVDKGLRGEHRAVCLCYQCQLFNPAEREKSCEVANAIYALDVVLGVTTPVWECMDFRKDASKD